MVQAWEEAREGAGEEEHRGSQGTVSLRAEVPEPLLKAMASFIECHPNWDQYRLFQAALAGFLVQHGVNNRDVTRCYLANLFPGSGGFDPLPGRRTPQPAPRPRPWPGLAA